MCDQWEKDGKRDVTLIKNKVQKNFTMMSIKTRPIKLICGSVFGLCFSMHYFVSFLVFRSVIVVFPDHAHLLFLQSS